uniref:Uncharacterized protein n=1 Tax=Rhizophora mucronata TaxID=61149 RepID=A0A2P2PJV8_RHIMU
MLYLSARCTTETKMNKQRQNNSVYKVIQLRQELRYLMAVNPQMEKTVFYIYIKLNQVLSQRFTE